ncbi:MAG TPA: hypothetical protein PLL30_00775 [Candidatus Krumholzibacteria bacterium]|nr:hypothetical protein [Candidatus Krumholzibacteria bacterium]HPD70294.1 hypothetical protein [Candidatus Krumholzibacteria bacterium]HRY40006.1 hypothetical protein [Candidatus Krumholzibacteria bacterium]
MSASRDVTSLDAWAPDDETLLQALQSRPPRRILLASDLHLGPGHPGADGVYDHSENFFAGEAFSNWLRRFAQEAPGAPGTLLVLDGDTFDFVRLGLAPRDRDYDAWSRRLASLGVALDADALRRAVDGSDRRYGLGSEEFKAVWKLDRVLDGHPEFLAALREWVGAGGRLLVLKGNHDLEMHWPRVRHALRQRICDGLSDPDEAARRIAFVDDRIIVANLMIEHGHEHEPMTAVRGPAVLGRDRPQLRYPLGSFLNRYLINALERINPFLDNLKPVDEALLAILRRRPVHVVKLYVRGWKFVKRALAMRRFGDGPTWSILAGLVLPPLTVLLIAFFVWRPEAWQAVARAVPWLARPSVAVSGGILGVLSPVLLPYLIGAGLEIVRSLRPRRPLDELAAAARKQLAEWSAVSPPWRRLYSVMGHTHRQDVHAFPLGEREGYYLNTGTWIPLWSRERPDLAGRVFYSFLQLDLQDDGEYRHRSLIWDDQAGAPRQAIILRSPDEESPDA